MSDCGPGRGPHKGLEREEAFRGYRECACTSCVAQDGRPPPNVAPGSRQAAHLSEKQGWQTRARSQHVPVSAWESPGTVSGAGQQWGEQGSEAACSHGSHLLVGGEIASKEENKREREIVTRL